MFVTQLKIQIDFNTLLYSKKRPLNQGPNLKEGACALIILSTFLLNIMVFCYQICSDLMWEEIVLVIEKWF